MSMSRQNLTRRTVIIHIDVIANAIWEANTFDKSVAKLGDYLEICKLHSVGFYYAEYLLI